MTNRLFLALCVTALPANSAFRMLDQDGKESYSCPLDKEKNPRRHPW